MPFLPATPADENLDLYRGPEGVAPPRAPDTDATQLEIAAFRQANTVVSLGRRLFDETYPPDPNHNPMDLIRGTKYEQNHLDNFVASRSEGETKAIMARIDGEEQDRQTLAAAGLGGVAVSLIAGMADPTTWLIPGGEVLGGARGAFAAGRQALRTGAAFGATAAAQEALLRASQETRTPGEAAVSIGSATLLGALIGPAAMKLLQPAERLALAGTLNRERVAMEAHAAGGVEAPVGFDVYHASPHDFEAFDSSKIGTGQGARSFGHGFYFSESPETHARYLEEFGQEGREGQLDNARTLLSLSRTLGNEAEVARLEKFIADFKEPGAAVSYKVRILADKERFLDWDKLSAEERAKLRNDPAYSQQLAQQGIPGIKYLDQGSRAAGEGSRNYVVFSERHLQVTHKNGQPILTPEPAPQVQPVQPSPGERITAAAIRTDGGKIYTGATHGEAVNSAAKDLGVSLDDLINKHMRDRESTDSLFLTSSRRVVTRGEAGKIASQEKQFKAVRSGGYTKAEDINMASTSPQLPLPLAVPAGAAATDTRELRLASTGIDKIPLVGAAVERLSPVTRLLGSESPAARRATADLAEIPLRTEENLHGIPSTQGPALDRIARQQTAATRVALSDQLDRLFSEYRFGEQQTYPRFRSQFRGLTGKGEGYMTFDQFKAEVSKALQEGDKHEIPQVEQAAKWVRSNVFDPWKQRAIDAGLFPDDVQAKGAESYLQRVYNKQAIAAKRPEWVQRVTEYLAGDQATKAASQERIRGHADALKASEAKIAKLEAQAEKLPAGDKARADIEFDARMEGANRDAIRGKIEDEITGWQGRSSREAKAALKTRAKAEAGREPGKPRLRSADATIDATVEKILASNRDLSVGELRGQADEITDRILGSPDGRLPYSFETGKPAPGAGKRGPLAERRFAIPDTAIRDFLEHDVEHIVSTHLRTIVPDVLLHERFGDVEMTEAFRKINDDYAALSAGAKSEKQRTKLEKERQRVIDDLAGIRDRVRGVYGFSAEMPMRNAARVAAAVKNYNVLTSMGMATISSLPDMAGAIFRYGLGSVFSDAWAPWLRSVMKADSGAYKEARRQFRAMGIVTDTILSTRNHALTDTMENYRPRSRVERTLQWGADRYMLANLLAPWTDWQKTMASMVSGSEILRASALVGSGKATKKQIATLAENGIDAAMAARIAKAFASGGEVRDGVHLPNTADWTDRTARQAFEGAVAREADIAVVTPGQEKPLWMSHPVASLMGQFKSFTAAATQRILLANLQRHDAQVLQGLIFSLGLGMLSYKLNSLLGGQATSDRPQDWIKEAISRGNILGWFEEGNSIASKASGGGVDIYRLIGADKPVSKYIALSARDQLLGPTWGKLEQLLKVTGATAKMQWTQSDTTALRRLVIMQNAWYLRGLLNKVEQSANNAFRVPEKRERQVRPPH